MSLASRIFTAALGLSLLAYFWPFGAKDPKQVVATESPGPIAKPMYPRTAAPQPKAPPQPDDKADAKRTAASKPRPPSESNGEANAERTAALEKKDAGEAAPGRKPKLFYRVIVRDGDTIEAGDVVITLSGIKAYDIDEKCKDGTGRTWPCGSRAQTALTRLIHGRAVSCVTPSSGKQKSFTARCTVGRTDLSVWMVTQGWATLAAPKDSKLADAAEAAQKKKLGIWR
jgi:endonuclease YncB( thermonuclease family)